MAKEPGAPFKRFHGRRLTRPLRGGRAAAIKNLLPKLEIPQKIVEQGALDPATLFSKPFDRTIFEIGFGNGKRLAQHMQQEPKTGFIGAEPFINGMAAFLNTIDDSAENIRIYMDDAITLARSFMPETIDAIYVLNPDPWHKKRHHKRRIINPENLDVLAAILKPGGRLIMSSDVPDLVDWMVTHAYNHKAFDWNAQTAADWQRPPEDWIPTRYETKGAKGAVKMSYLFFTKKDKI